MEIALAVIAVIVVVGIALFAIGHAVGSTEAMPRQIVIDSHEAIEFCAQALPDWVTASLSYDELRRLLRLHLEWIQAYHWAPASSDAAPSVFEQFDPVTDKMERAQVVDLDVTRDEVEAVVQAHSDYLQVMGALHIDDPVDVEADLAELPLLEADDPKLLLGDDQPEGDLTD